MIAMTTPATPVTPVPVSQILLTIAKEFGFSAAESLLELLDTQLKSYNVGASYNSQAPSVQAHITSWQRERGLSQE